VTTAQMRELLEGCPVPADWHPGAAGIRAWHADFRAAIESLERGERWDEARLAPARERLHSMVDPEGRHPFVGDIVDALAASREALDRVGTLPA
jgi:hypothetical protein